MCQTVFGAVFEGAMQMQAKMRCSMLYGQTKASGEDRSAKLKAILYGERPNAETVLSVRIRSLGIEESHHSKTVLENH